MKKSTAAFVLGLIFGLISAVCAYLFWVVFVIVGAFSSGYIKIVLNVVPFINIAMSISSIIGASVCLKKAKVGGIILIPSSIISLLCSIIAFISLKTINIILVMSLLPSLFTLLAGLIALKKSPK